MLLIETIHLKNIKSHRDTTLSFSAGINVLSGPNGVGKSTVFEAIGYALFGVDARDFVSNIERFLSIGAKRGEVSVTFRVDAGDTWRVTRTVGGGVKWLLAREIASEFEVEEHANIRETEARLAELLGLANGRPLSEQFKLVIGPFQNDFLGPFVIKQATKRQEAFDETLGIDAWRKTYKGTSGLLSAVQHNIGLLVAEVEGKQEQVAVLPEREQALADLKTEISAQRRLLEETTKQLETTGRRLAECEMQEEALRMATTAVQELDIRIQNGKDKVATQRETVDQARAAVATLEKCRAGKESFEKADAALKSLREKERASRSLERHIAQLEKDSLAIGQRLEHENNEVQKAGQELDAEQQRLAAARKELQPDAALVETAAGLKTLRQEAEALRTRRGLLTGRRVALAEGQEKLAEGVCPFFAEPCRNIEGQQPRDVFSHKMTQLDAQVAELDARIEKNVQDSATAEKARQALDALKVRSAELDKQQTQLESRRQANAGRADGLAALQERQAKAVESLEERRKERKAFDGLEEALLRTEQERATYQTARDSFYAHAKDAGELDARQKTLTRWQHALDGLVEDRKAKLAERDRCQKAYDPSQHQRTRQQKEQRVGEIAGLQQRIKGLEKDDERLTADITRLKQLQKLIAERLEQKKHYEEQEQLVKYLRNRVFRNVSNRLSERFREEISQRADRIYRTIAEGDEELLWGDNYQVVLRDMADGQLRERTDDQLSGGQMMSAVVALRLALLQTIGARVAFFDEPTSNLDAARRENLAHAFRAIDVGREEVTEHWYDQLFLVSHDVAFTEITDQMIPLGE
ncbi:DNA repair exonuclease SbcCD, C subunit, putative [Syntrophotalea carbinolica DSM 2380]|uniref:DNA repair exonuclease SbcCD, C subunit, putative n=1 Tax=Syntrophotalea carbinolica (strain DSM 2380 / NBRC 103641 / GraBd1) TaxID=338963 RepID=Q3A4T5_SYNC1|nr:SMC family ATPase [Syntrophotalea carbinolica]ABA88622.1 DNA repair exonuclease SbcCD, C subunit, putative [Syntrophotalea carbinolica DSM 2380]